MSDLTAGTPASTPDAGTPVAPAVDAGTPVAPAVDEDTPGAPYVPTNRDGWTGRTYTEGRYLGIQETGPDGRPDGPVTAYQTHGQDGPGYTTVHVLTYVATFPTWADALAALDAEDSR